jgi:hypothetical protein
MRWSNVLSDDMSGFSGVLLRQLKKLTGDQPQANDRLLFRDAHWNTKKRSSKVTFE